MVDGKLYKKMKLVSIEGFEDVVDALLKAFDMQCTHQAVVPVKARALKKDFKNMLSVARLVIGNALKPKYVMTFFAKSVPFHMHLAYDKKHNRFMAVSNEAVVILPNEEGSYAKI